MGGREVAFRFRRLLAAGREARRLASGWSPEPEKLPEDGIVLLDPEPSWREAWRANFTLDTEALADLAAGRIDLFGGAVVGVGSPPRWHHDPTTGITAPLRHGPSIDYRDPAVVGDIKLLWEVSRHHHLLPLARGYAVSGAVRWREAVTGQVEDWVAANPYGRGVHWSSALEAALRLIAWAWIHNLLRLRHEGGLLSCTGEAVRRSIYHHAWFVAHHLSRHSSANNHLIGELTGLYLGSVAFDLGKTGRRWRAAAWRELQVEARRQVASDGVDREQAVCYHQWVAEYLLLAGLVAQRAGDPVPPDWWERLAKMGAFLRAISAAGGAPPQIGDSDDGMVTRFAERWPLRPAEDLLAALDGTIGDPPRRPLSPSEKGFWYGRLAGGERIGLPSPPPSGEAPVIFSEGGYAVFTSTTSGSRLKLVFDAGPLGYLSIAAHGHADALSMVLAIDGDWWLVDPGTYAYHDHGRWRGYFRSTCGHNTVCIDRHDQSRPGGPFLWLRHAPARLLASGAEGAAQWVEGIHHGYDRGAGPVVHRRRVALEGGRLTVEDHLTGHGSHHVALHFHLAPEIEVEERGRGAFRLTRSDRPAAVELVGDPRLRWRAARGEEAPPLGWYAPRLGSRLPATTLCGEMEGALPEVLTTEIRVHT